MLDKTKAVVEKKIHSTVFNFWPNCEMNEQYK